jgi:hypothetical protein
VRSDWADNVEVLKWIKFDECIRFRIPLDIRSCESSTGNQRWTAVARLQAVIITAAMDEVARSAWCPEQGLYPAELDAWKQEAIAGLDDPQAASAAEALQDRRRVRELERELHRKDKALAEMAALLVLFPGQVRTRKSSARMIRKSSVTWSQ